MLHSMGEREAASRIERAVERAYAETDVRTQDLGGTASTSVFTDAIMRLL